MILLKRTVIGLAVVISILNGAIGRKLTSSGHADLDYDSYGRYTSQGAEYSPDSRQRPVNEEIEPSLLSYLIQGVKRIVFRRPVDRQAGALSGLASAVQAAAVPLALAGMAAAQRETILNAITTEAATTASTASTTVDYCTIVTCSGNSDTCDKGSGLCYCGSGGSCGGAPDQPSNICTSSECKCGTSTACSSTTPVCKEASSPYGDPTSTSTTAECQCIQGASTTCSGTTPVCCDGKLPATTPCSPYGDCVACKGKTGDDDAAGDDSIQGTCPVSGTTCGSTGACA